MKKKISKISALISVAFTQSSEALIDTESVDFNANDLNIYKADLNTVTPLYLAAHRSHSSHQSHGSHRSSSPSSTKKTYTAPSTSTIYKDLESIYDSTTGLFKSNPLGQTPKPISSIPLIPTLNYCSDSKFAKRKSTVKQVQMYLYITGHLSSVSFDGVVDDKTRRAVKKFKADHYINDSNTLLDSVTLNTMGIMCE